MRKKRALALVLILAMALGIMIPTVYADDKVVHIANAQDLEKLAKKCRLDTYSENLTVILDNDIDLGGAEFVPIPSFSGTFSGNNHTISNFVLANDGSNQGFFRYVQKEGTVTNLNLKGTVAPSGTQTNIGGMVGVNFGDIVESTFDGTVAGIKNIGGIAGENHGTVRGCYSYGNISGKRYTGGIVGSNLGTVTECLNIAEVNTAITESGLELDDLSIADLTDLDLAGVDSTDTVSYSGGIAGGSTGTIMLSTNYGTIGYQHYGYNVGGIAGRQSGYIYKCENYGHVYGRTDVGGIVGNMEPNLILQTSGNITGELNKLNELIDEALDDGDDQNGKMTDILNVIAGKTTSASSNASVLVTSLGSFVDDTVDSTNEVLNRVDYAIKALDPVMQNVHDAMSDFSDGMVHLDNSMDNIELDDESLDALHEGMDDLSTSMGRIGDELSYLSYLSACYFNKKKDGDVDLSELMPTDEEKERLEEEYGYDFSLDAGSKTSVLEKGMLKACSDLITDGARAAKACKKILDVLDDYYLTPYYDTDGDGVADKSRLEYAQDEGSLARDYFTWASEYLEDASSGLENMTTYLASLEKVQFDTLGDEYYTASKGLFNDINSIAKDMSDLNNTLDDTSGILNIDLTDVNDQFTKIMVMLSNAITGRADDQLFEDTSADDSDDITDGKVRLCVNGGTVEGDSNVGGIAGTMGIEYETSLDLEEAGVDGMGADSIFYETYDTKCVVKSCTNNGSVSAKKTNVGGIAGSAEMGMIVDSEGYGGVASTEGGYVGGIAGDSKAIIRRCYSMCSLEGSEYVGGIAGYGATITDSVALVGMNDYTVTCCGAIAGYADVNGEDNTIKDNRFVNDEIGAVDGISYTGKAVPVTYDDLYTDTKIPSSFKQLRLTFVADGQTVAEVRFEYGGSISEADIPAVPEKEGFTGEWPEYDYSCLYYSDTLVAEYTSKQATMATDKTRDDSPMSIVLVEGDFADKAKVYLNEYTGEGPEVEDAEVYEKWVVRVEGDNGDKPCSVRYLPPAGDKGTREVDVYVLKDGAWSKVDTSSSGSYVVFESDSETVVFAAVERTSKGVWGYLFGGMIAAGAAGTGYTGYRVGTRKKKHGKH